MYRKQVQTQRLRKETQKDPPLATPAGNRITWLTGPHFHATKIWRQRWVSRSLVSTEFKAQPWPESYYIPHLVHSDWTCESSLRPLWWFSVPVTLSSHDSIFLEKVMINVLFQPIAPHAVSRQLRGGEGRQGGNLLHYFQLNFTPFMRLFQTTPANKSLGCIPPLLSSFSDLLEHFLSPSATYIMPCLFHHWLTCECHFVSLTRLGISGGLGLYFKIVLYLPPAQNMVLCAFPLNPI